MDTRKLQVAPKIGQVVIVQDDEIVARVYHSDRRDNVEATEYAEELVCRWNIHDELVNTLADLVATTGMVENIMDGDKDKQEAWREELGRIYVAIDAARQLLNTIEHA